MAGRISVTAEVVGTGSDGTEPSVVFAVHRHGVYSADKTLLQRYLFNCGEGTQRLCGENSIKLNSLDSIFLTRLEVRSASGIPGLVFALGGLGAAHLRVHGPRGTRGRLCTMESFVRRKYPKIECVEVDGNAQGEAKRDDSVIAQRVWSPREPQEDAYARIMAVPLACAPSTPTGCWICEKCSPLIAPPARTTASQQDTPSQSDLDPDRQWLRRFYESKSLHEKIAHMDAILRRYRGRIDELKMQLINKYGASEDSASASSSESEDESEGQEHSTPFDANVPLDRKWLEGFYQQYEPAKVGRVDQILRQFDGREEQLKSMLLAKYGGEPKQPDNSPPTKKQKTDHSSEKNEHGSAGISIPELIVDGEVLVPTPELSPQANASLCYMMQFRSPPFPVVWVVDCHDTDHIDSLSAMLRKRECSHSPVLIVHFSPAQVVGHPKYEAWVKTLNEESDNSVEHLVFDGAALRKVNGGVFSFAFAASARNYLRNIGEDGVPKFSRWENLRTLLAPRSPLSQQETTQPPPQLRILKRSGGGKASATVAQAKLKFILADTAIVDYSRTGWKDVVERTSADEDQDQAPSSLTLQPRHTSVGRQVSILGTGSAAPSKLRASTSIYVSLSSEYVDGVVPGMLVDCGEGTFGQLQRQFDTDASLANRLAGLKCIWISHHHADHQCGLLRVLDEYVRVMKTLSIADARLYLIAPQGVLEYVKAWLPDLPPRICLLTCAEMNDREDCKAHMRAYVDSMRSVRVWHCHDAFGLVLHLRGGPKIVYSGDTKPVDQLVRAGMDASLLIHEATFDDSMEDDAEKKKHSTVGQAIDVARRMRAKRLVLTHFSQRYPALPPPMSSPVEGSDGSAMPEIYCAYDGFTVSLEEPNR